jgi:hypothetical protein
MKTYQDQDRLGHKILRSGDFGRTALVEIGAFLSEVDLLMFNEFRPSNGGPPEALTTLMTGSSYASTRQP